MLPKKTIEVVKADAKNLLEVHSPGTHILDISSQFGEGVYALSKSLNGHSVMRCSTGWLELNGEDTEYGASPDSGNSDELSNRFGDSDETNFTARFAEYCEYVAGACTNFEDAGLVAEGCYHDGQLKGFIWSDRDGRM